MIILLFVLQALIIMYVGTRYQKTKDGVIIKKEVNND